MTFFAHSGIPLTVAIVLDTSGSMDGALGAAQEAATGFIRRLTAGDRAAVIDFDTRVRIVQPFTVDIGALENAVRSTVADGRTALYDASTCRSRSSKGCRTRTSTRRVDTRLSCCPTARTPRASSSSRPCSTSRTGRTPPSTRSASERDEGGRLATFEAESALRRLAIQTGGRAFFPTDMEQLHSIYNEIRRDLASQYTIAYASTNGRRDGRWRNVTVRLAQRDLDAHTRPG